MATNTTTTIKEELILNLTHKTLDEIYELLNYLKEHNIEYQRKQTREEK